MNEVIDFRCGDPENARDLFLGKVAIIIRIENIAVDRFKLLEMFGDELNILFFFQALVGVRRGRRFKRVLNPFLLQTDVSATISSQSGFENPKDLRTR